jgi:hypothetical protein
MNEILNNGLDAYEQKKEWQFTTGFIIVIFCIITTIFFSCSYAVKCSELKAYKFQVSQRDSLIAALKSDNNELLHDNLEMMGKIIVK